MIASYNFYIEKRNNDPELIKAAQIETYALLEKMRSYNLRLDNFRALPTFSAPEEIMDSP